jgi:hypothetical protein
MQSRWAWVFAKIAACGAMVLLPGHSPATAAPTQLSKECIEAARRATVERAFKVEAREPPSKQAEPEQPPPQPNAAPPPEVIRLGDVIAVKVTSLEALKKECQSTPIILYLNGYPIRTVRPYPPSQPGELRFVLKVTDAKKATDGTVLPETAANAEKSNEIWRPVLGRPPWFWQDNRLVELSVGLEGQPPLGAALGKSLPLFQLNVLNNRYFLGWGLLFAAMLAAFWFLAFKSNILRNGNPTVVTAGVKGTCSLSKFQGAIWFFVILAAYLFIGIVTGDYLNSINGTALILLGIGAGTVVGSAAIDAYKDEPEKRKTDTEDVTKKLKALDDELTKIRANLDVNEKASDAFTKAEENPAGRDAATDNDEMKTIRAALTANDSARTLLEQRMAAPENKDKIDEIRAGLDANETARKPIEEQMAAAEDREKERLKSEHAILTRQRLNKEAERTVVQSNFDKLTGRSEGWWVDILSDANGVSLHRFQLAAFTLVLAFVFVLGVYDDLAMPEFNTTLMGLLGLSASTYLGLKIPEATLPKKTS